MKTIEYYGPFNVSLAHVTMENDQHVKIGGISSPSSPSIDPPFYERSIKVQLSRITSTRAILLRTSTS